VDVVRLVVVWGGLEGVVRCLGGVERQVGAGRAGRSEESVCEGLDRQGGAGKARSGGEGVKGGEGLMGARRAGRG
jgi:hypothetical protein